MSVVVESVYPSTNDCAKTLLPETDAVLECLINARERYVASPTQSAYIGGAGQVCAFGAVFATDGFTADDLDRIDEESSHGIYQTVEAELSYEAMTAIELLNAAAIELYPEVPTTPPGHVQTVWSGPLEAVNQNLGTEEFADAVRRCYDLAIERREQVVA